MSFLRLLRYKITGFPGMGRVPYWDPRNERYKIEDVLPPRSLALAEQPPRKHKTRMHRAWRFYDQGRLPYCTSYGTYTCMAADPVRQPKRGAHLGDPNTFYAEIQAIDRAEGRFYSAGATGLAAMKAATARGWFGEYRWTTDADVALVTIEDVSPIMCGTNWYSSFFDRDAEGIIRITPAARLSGGHWYCVNGYNPRSGLVRIAQTWGNGYYFMPDTDFARLVGEEAEVVLARELVVTRTFSSAVNNENDDDGN